MSYPFVDIQALVATFGDTMAERGRSYVAQDRVLTLKFNEETGRLVGRVRGSEDKIWRASVTLRKTDGSLGGIPIWDVDWATCSCPVGLDCKHAAALIFESNQRTVATSDVLTAADLEQSHEPQDSEAGIPGLSWRQVVNELLPVIDSDQEFTDVALGVEIDALHTEPSGYRTRFVWREATASDLENQTDLTVRLRPLRVGARGRWIKGNMNWTMFDLPFHQSAHGEYQFLPEQHDALHELNRLYTSSVSSLGSNDVITLATINMPQMWDVLDKIDNAGIQLVPLQKIINRVTITEPARMIFDAAENEQEDVALSIQAQLPSETLIPSGTLGAIGLYTIDFYPESATADINVIPVAQPLSRTVMDLIESPEPMLIPADDTQDFFDNVYPLLAGVIPLASQDHSVDLPDIPPSTLELTLEYYQATHQGERQDHVRISSRWDYLGTEDQTEHQNQVLAEISDDIDLGTVPGKTILVGADAARFVDESLPELLQHEYVRIVETEERPAYTRLTGEPHIVINATQSEKNDWFDLGFQVTIEERTIPFRQLFIALVRNQNSLLLTDGTYFSLDNEAFDPLRKLLEEASTMDDFGVESTAISRFNSALLDDAEEAADAFHADPAIVEWQNALAVLREATDIPKLDVPAMLDAELRDYQHEGYEWLSYLYDLGLGGILADDMGLGKTLQSLAMIARAKAQGEQRPFLVIAPSSVLPVWRDEVERFAPGLRVVVVDVSNLRRSETIDAIRERADVVVTSYSIARLDEAFLSEDPWAGLILDEAQFVKNHQTKAHKAIRNFRAGFKLAITGTPMENTLSDLWSIFRLVVPGMLPRFAKFRDDYLRPIEAGQRVARTEPGKTDDVETQVQRQTRSREAMTKLRTKIRLFMLRRTKESVAAELPEKQEMVLQVQMEREHEQLYQQILQRERKNVLNLVADMDSNRISIFRSLTLLRMLALDPSIVDDQYAHVPSSKLNELMSRLTEILPEGHRVLIFSQFTSFLGRLGEQLDQRDIDYAYLDGSTRNRGEAVEQFRAGDAPVFLISLRAGGFGLTLTEADYVFLLDPWWNPAVEAQAVDRAHRIGQDKNVMVYRMVSKGSIEEKVLALQQQKIEMFAALTEDDTAFASNVTAEDIRALFDDSPVDLGDMTEGIEDDS